MTTSVFQPTLGWVMKNPLRIFGFGFGMGLVPKAPGTWGTIPGVIIAGLLLGMGMSKPMLFMLSLVLFLCGIVACNAMERELGVHDYKGIVCDEIVAMMMLLSCIPQGLGWWLAAFVIFRFFDAVKPYPIRQIDAKVRGGLGVMLDDSVAALMSLIVLQIIYYLF